MTSFPLTVAVKPSALQLKPGGAAQVAVTVTNVSDIVEHYQVTIVGLPSNDYWSAEPAVTKLRPRESGSITVRITLPERGGIFGGRYDLGVLVTSPYQADVSRSADLVLDVGAVSGITLTATPMTAYGKTSAAYALSLTNDGNIDVPVELVAADDQGRATIAITPPSLRIRPGGAQAAQVAVDARGIITGQDRRSTITVKAVAAGETRGEVQLSFIQTPRIAPAVFRVLGIVLAVAVVAGAIVIGGLLGRNAPAAAPSEAAASPAGAGASGGASASAASASAGGASASTPPPAPTVSAITVDPATPLVDAETTLTATASAGATTWAWQVVDTGGSEVARGSTSGRFTLRFPAAGAFTVKLAVTDAAGQKVDATPLAVTVAEQPPSFEVIRKAITIAAGQPANDAAACSDDMVVLAGGVDVVTDGTNPPGTVLQASFGTGDPDTLNQWTAAVLNPTTGVVNATVTAVCAQAPAGYVVVTNTTDTSVEPGTSNETTLTCPDGLVVLGGGGGIRSDTVTDTQSYLEESTPVQDGDGHWTQWRVRAHNNAASAQPLSAEVTCAAKPAGYTVRDDQQSVPPGTGSELAFVPACPAGTQVVGGGSGVTESPADPGTQMVLRASSTVTTTDGSDVPQWSTALSFTGTAEQSITGRAVCARLPQ